MADYPWDQCIRDQIERYGSKDKAERVCGMIRSKYGKSWTLKNNSMMLPDDVSIEDILDDCEKELGLAARKDKPQADEPSVKANLRYLKALGIDKPDQFFADVVAVKSIGGDEIKGYLALWGNPDRVDIEGDYFTKSTDFWDGVLSTPRPLTWNHGQDRDTFKSADVVGQITAIGDDDTGRFYTAMLDRSHKYRKAISKLIDRRILGTSSDSAPQYVIREQTGKSHWLKQWPLFAGALTDVPAEPRMIGSIDYFKGLGVDLATLISAEAAQQARRADEQAMNDVMRLHDILKLHI